jgi:hypothetical protein
VHFIYAGLDLIPQKGEIRQHIIILWFDPRDDLTGVRKIRAKLENVRTARVNQSVLPVPYILYIATYVSNDGDMTVDSSRLLSKRLTPAEPLPLIYIINYLSTDVLFPARASYGKRNPARLFPSRDKYSMKIDAKPVVLSVTNV